MKLLKKDVEARLNLMEEVGNYTYAAKKLNFDLSKEKQADLVKIYDKFIDSTLEPGWLPASPTVETPRVTVFSPSSELALEHRAALMKEIEKKMLEI